MPYVFQYRRTAEARPSFACALTCLQCSATTKAGARCKRRTCLGLPLCRSHLVKLRVGPAAGGLGLFAKVPGGPQAVAFARGETVVEYAGENISEAEVTRRYGPSDDDVAPYVVAVRDGRFEDGACRRGLGSLANHLDRGHNARFKVADGPDGRPRVLIVAQRAIRNGEEITVYYGDDYLEEHMAAAAAQYGTDARSAARVQQALAAAAAQAATHVTAQAAPSARVKTRARTKGRA